MNYAHSLLASSLRRGSPAEVLDVLPLTCLGILYPLFSCPGQCSQSAIPSLFARAIFGIPILLPGMDPYPSPGEGKPLFQQSPQQRGELGHKERKQRPKLLHKRPPYNPQFHSGKVGRNEGPRRIPGSQSCFNCGSPGHWAQDCPGPRKTVPK